MTSKKNNLNLFIISFLCGTSLCEPVLRPLVKKVSAPKRIENDLSFTRSAVGGELDHLGPFLLLDHWGGTYEPHEAVSGSDHPHRGFETVSYILKGGIFHEDSAGNSGLLTEGSVQWMTAGSGVLHSEMHSPDIWENGGEVEGFQIWVNLRAKDKMIPPSYQDTPSEIIPVVWSQDQKVRVKIIAGQALDTKAVVTTRTPLIYLDVHLLSAGAQYTEVVPASHEAMIYIYRGSLKILVDLDCVTGGTDQATCLQDSVSGEAGQLLVLGDGDFVSVMTDSPSGCKFLLLSGEPLKEPIARYGPFVMNTEQQIQDAFDDYQSGMFGEVPGKEQREIKRKVAANNIQKRKHRIHKEL